ncbi:MAG TPA: hypothetical protein VJ915_03290 [Balneolaceae bacterium]|nr:hypothetical protein [Balneolaceae bacterium]
MKTAHIISDSCNPETDQLTKYLAFWTLGWVVSMAIASFGPTYLWESATWINLTAIVVNFALGVGMIMSNIRLFKAQDELMQQIQLKAMGIALGLGVVGGLSYSLLDITNVIEQDAEIAFLVMGVSITYLVSLVTDNIRYR